VASVEVIQDSSALPQRQSEWQALAASCGVATVFQTWEWNSVWWRHFGRLPGRRLCLVTMRDTRGVLVGIAPLMTEFWRRTPLRCLSFLGTGQSDYLDILAAPGWELAVTEALYAHLKQRGDWVIADWPNVRAGGILREHSPATSLNLPFRNAETDVCPYLTLPQTGDALTLSLGRHLRTNLGYYDRAIRRVYRTEYHSVAANERCESALDDLFELHERRWNDLGQFGAFRSRRVRAFHHEVAQEAHARGWLRLLSLRLDGSPEASWYGFSYGGLMLYYQSGFEPTLARWSLGTLLTTFALRTAVEEGCATFDFGCGAGNSMAKWTNQTHCNQRRVLTRFPGLLPLVLRAVERD